MSIKSKTLKINFIGKGKIPVNLEGVQLALQNAERLFNDSQKVSIPTKVSLLEIGLEEIAKTWGILLGYEKTLFNNHDSINTYFQSLHIDQESYNKKIDELDSRITEFFDNADLKNFFTPFDTKSFSNHNAKIKFLSKFIKYIREIELPIIRSGSDRIKSTREIFGKYISKNKLINIKEADKIIDNILDIDYEQLNYIINLKEHGLYLDVENNTYISPNARSFETGTLENLLSLLISMAKNEVSLLFIVLGKIKT